MSTVTLEVADLVGDLVEFERELSDGDPCLATHRVPFLLFRWRFLTALFACSLSMGARQEIESVLHNIGLGLTFGGYSFLVSASTKS